MAIVKGRANFDVQINFDYGGGKSGVEISL